MYVENFFKKMQITLALRNWTHQNNTRIKIEDI